MYPVCAMLEYASMRFTFVWASATTLPAVIVTAARIARTAPQSTPSGPIAPTSTRRIAANAAAFGPTDMNAVAGVRSEEHTSELQSRQYLVCRLLLEKKETTKT